MNSKICLFLTSYLHRLAVITFYEFIPWDLHKILQDVTFIHSIKFRAVWLRISGYMTMNFMQHYPDYFGRDDFRVTWPVTGIAWRSSPARALIFFRLSHASFAVKASRFVSGGNFIAWPLPIGINVAETLQATAQSILINFYPYLGKFLWK